MIARLFEPALHLRIGSAAALMAACGLPPVESPLGGDTDGYDERFYIGEQNQYNSPLGECELNFYEDILGTELRDSLKVKGWQGPYRCDVQSECPDAYAEPIDFVEASYELPNGVIGEDQFWADDATLAVFAGHGAHNILSYRRPTTTMELFDVCEVNLYNEMSLGYAWGNKARVALFAASCVGYAADLNEVDGTSEDFRDSLGRSNSWQFLAFQDSPSLELNHMSDFVGQMSNLPTKSTTSAFIQAFDFNGPDTFNQPIVYTTTDNVVDAGQPFDYIATRHEQSNLMTGEHLPPVAASTFDHYIATSSMTDTDPDNDDPEPTECQDNLSGN